jgi:hypothetical protein
LSQPRSNTVLVALLALVLLLAGLGLGWVIWAPDPVPQSNHAASFNSSTAKHNDIAPIELQPANEPEPLPEPERKTTVIDLTPVRLGPLTLFRGLVKEADYALILRDQPDAPKEVVWEAVSTLEQLKSRFAPFARLVYEGTAEGVDRIHFESDVKRSFEGPDVGSAAYNLEAAPRTAIWLREGAKLPTAEITAPPEVSIPLTRRLQETVTPEVAAAWLKAIEGEYGVSDFGPDALPLDIVIYPDLRSYLNFSAKRLGLEVPEWSAGYYTSKWDVICIPVLENTSMAEVIRHEMFHALQAHKAPQSLLVPWFAEGSAEWLDKIAPDTALRTHPEFAAAAYGYLRTLIVQGLKLELKAFLEQGIELFYQNPELNYLIAYCFVDFVRGEEDLRKVYFDFWKLMCEGTGHENAFARTFGGLDMAELQRRFIEKINKFAQTSRPPRFSHDAPAEYFEFVPRELGGNGVEPPVKEGEVSQGWFKVLGDLQAAGFDTSRASFLKGDYDLLIVAVDHSETMAQTITTPNFDFDALSRWLFSMRYAGTLAFTRKSPDGSTKEEVPASVLLAMVDAVLTDRVQQFIDTAGIKVGQEIQDDILENYGKFEITGEALAAMAKRDIARHTAESAAWYWGTRQDESDVVLVDYNMQVVVENELSGSTTKGFNSSSSPLIKLFGKTQGNAAPAGSNGADTDWWLGFQSLVAAAHEKGAQRVACMFFTDGPNSLGFYGHMEDGRNDTNYYADQQKLAEALKLEWEAAGITSESVLQLFALPGGEGQGLDFIPQKVAVAKLDEWATHFMK